MKILLLINDFATGNEILKIFNKKYKKNLLMVIVKNNRKLFSKIKFKNKLFIGNNTLYNKIKYLKFDIGLIAWWPDILNPKEIKLASKFFINIHPGYLPYCKGKNANFWALLKKQTYGVTIHKINNKIDDGDILFRKEIKKNWIDTGETLLTKAKKIAPNLLKNNISKIINNKFKLIKNTGGSIHYSKQFFKIQKLNLKTKYKLEYLLNLLRAKKFTGYNNCYFIDNNKKYYIDIKIKEKHE